MNIRIRRETSADIQAIEALTTAAFRDAPHTSHTEHFIVNALREAGKLTVSMVAQEIAEIVERRLLGVAEAARVHLEAGAVRLHPHDAALVGEEKPPPLLRLHVRALVADAPVNPAVRSRGEAVHVVTGIGDVHAKTVGEDLALVWRARRAGLRLQGLDAAMLTSARRYRQRGWLRTTLRHLRLTALLVWREMRR